ncbi:hypothetical protein [Sporosarcina limicola]|uniref:Uncharacterized protein n=1 Tax=Sporosarcina limicola TaxID=34101 RepID=A0A927R6C2_9BACL|nr:hypothetical protein [Sporosarcina limicola]MBE1557028.1 hypothetical protein [Sporosarcina limicola]
MDLYEKLKTVSPKKKTYFINRHDLQFMVDAPKKTDEELCKILDVKTLSTYVKWERSPQYLELLNLYLQTKFANDLDRIYTATQEKALEGDEKSIKLLLDIQKQIRLFNKENNVKKTDNSNAYAELEL